MKTGTLQCNKENFSTDFSSDHTPIILDLICNISQNFPPQPSRTIDLKQFEILKNEITFTFRIGSSPTNIDSTIENLTNTISQNLEKCTTIRPPSKNPNKLPRSIQSEINLKRYLRSQWQHFRDPFVKTTLNCQTSFVRHLMEEYRNSQWSNFLGSLSDRDEGLNRFFKLNKSLLRKLPPVHPLRRIRKPNIRTQPQSRTIRRHHGIPISDSHKPKPPRRHG